MVRCDTGEYVHAFQHSKLEKDVGRLRRALKKLRRNHRTCEDSFYSCPKSEDGPWDVRFDTDCNCGADEANAEIAAALDPQ